MIYPYAIWKTNFMTYEILIFSWVNFILEVIYD